MHHLADEVRGIRADLRIGVLLLVLAHVVTVALILGRDLAVSPEAVRVGTPASTLQGP